MDASELIHKLQELVKEHGDLPVRYEGFDGAAQEPNGVAAYTEYGNYPDSERPAVEFWLHRFLV